MPVRSAQAEWKGDLPTGKGIISTETGTVDGRYSFSSRFGCPISRALSANEITLDAALEG